MISGGYLAGVYFWDCALGDKENILKDIKYD
jgi:hypothetical protein